MRAITDMSTPKKHVGMKRYATETTSTSSTGVIGTPNTAIIGMSTQDPKPELTVRIVADAIRRQRRPCPCTGLDSQGGRRRSVGLGFARFP
jgi:hypothetical protein